MRSVVCVDYDMYHFFLCFFFLESIWAAATPCAVAWGALWQSSAWIATLVGPGLHPQYTSAFGEASGDPSSFFFFVRSFYILIKPQNGICTVKNYASWARLALAREIRDASDELRVLRAFGTRNTRC